MSINIKRTEEYTENTLARYRLPNTSTMEKLAMQVTAGEGAVLRYYDHVVVTDRVYGGFIAGIYEFIDGEDDGFSEIERRLNLVQMGSAIYEDGGRAIAWAMGLN